MTGCIVCELAKFRVTPAAALMLGLEVGKIVADAVDILGEDACEAHKVDSCLSG